MRYFILAAALLAACAQNAQLTDATEHDREVLQRHIQERAAGLLATGEQLSVEIVDIDRAGGFEARSAELGTVRIVRDVYPARIVVRFKFQGKDGTRTLTGLPVAGAARYGNDPLRYERALLDDWLERELRRTAR